MPEDPKSQSYRKDWGHCLFYRGHCSSGASGLPDTPHSTGEADGIGSVLTASAQPSRSACPLPNPARLSA